MLLTNNMNSNLQKSHFFQFADIARQMIESAPGNQTDVILGGGMLSFKNGSNSNSKWVCSRQDGRDLIKGYKIDYFNLRISNFYSLCICLSRATDKFIFVQ